MISQRQPLITEYSRQVMPRWGLWSQLYFWPTSSLGDSSHPQFSSLFWLVFHHFNFCLISSLLSSGFHHNTHCVTTIIVDWQHQHVTTRCETKRTPFPTSSPSWRDLTIPRRGSLFTFAQTWMRWAPYRPWKLSLRLDNVFRDVVSVLKR